MLFLWEPKVSSEVSVKEVATLPGCDESWKPPILSLVLAGGFCVILGESGFSGISCPLEFFLLALGLLETLLLLVFV